MSITPAICKWDWCPCNFDSQDALVEHVMEAHVATVVAVKRKDVSIIRRAEEGVSGDESLVPRIRFDQSQSTTLSSLTPYTTTLDDKDDLVPLDDTLHPSTHEQQRQQLQQEHHQALHLQHRRVQPFDSPPRSSSFHHIAVASSPNCTPEPSPLPPSPSMGELISSISTRAAGPGDNAGLVGSETTAPPAHSQPHPSANANGNPNIQSNAPQPPSGTTLSAVSQTVSQIVQRSFRSGSMQIKLSPTKPLQTTKLQPAESPSRAQRPDADRQTDVGTPEFSLQTHRNGMSADDDVDAVPSLLHAARHFEARFQSQSQGETQSTSQSTNTDGNASSVESQWPLQTQAPYGFTLQSQSQ